MPSILNITPLYLGGAFFCGHSVVVGGLRFYRDFSFFLLFFVTYSPSSPNGTQPRPATLLGSECDLEMRVRNLEYSLSPANRSPTRLFRRLRKSTASLTAYIFRTKFDTHRRASVLQATKGLLQCLKTRWTLIHKRLKIGPAFYP